MIRLTFTVKKSTDFVFIPQKYQKQSSLYQIESMSVIKRIF